MQSNFDTLHLWNMVYNSILFAAFWLSCFCAKVEDNHLTKYQQDDPLLIESKLIVFQFTFREGTTYKDMRTSPNHVLRYSKGKMPFRGDCFSFAQIRS